jgi:hypothetical protein
MGLFSHFLFASSATCRAAECRGPNAIAKSGLTAIHDPRLRRANKQAAP